MNLWFLVPAIGILLRYNDLVPYLFFAYTTQAIENSFGYGLLMINWFLFGIIRIPKELLWATVFLIICGIVNAKLIVFCIPFLAIGWTYAISNLDIKQPLKTEKYKKLGIMCIGLMQILIILFSFSGQMPTNQDWQNFQTFENYKPQIEHRNDFGFGHFLRFLGYTPSAISGGSFAQTFENSIALTVQDLNCLQIKDFDRFPFTNEKIGYGIFDCTN